MWKRPLRSPDRPLRCTNGDTLPVDRLEPLAQGWLLDGDPRQLSPQTRCARKFLVEKLLWFLRTHGHSECGTPEVRAFLADVSTGHDQEGGRWGNPLLKRAVRPRTAHTYHGDLRTFFRWLVGEVGTSAGVTGVPDEAAATAEHGPDSMFLAGPARRCSRRAKSLLLPDMIGVADNNSSSVGRQPVRLLVADSASGAGVAQSQGSSALAISPPSGGAARASRGAHRAAIPTGQRCAFLRVLARSEDPGVGDLVSVPLEVKSR